MPEAESSSHSRQKMWRQAAVPLLIAAGLASFFLAPRWSPVPHITINNPGQPQTIKLTPQPEQNPAGIYYLSLRIVGEIDGTVVLQREFNKEPQDQLILTTGKIEEIWSTDWFKPECQIQLNPTKGTTGHIKMEYKFSDL